MLRWFRKQQQKNKRCIFCEIYEQQKQVLLYEDDDYFAIDDISKASAQQHLLIITKKHIVSSLEVQHPQQLINMRDIGQSILTKRNIHKNNMKFGFHLPPYNSINHIHLHCFALPFTNLLHRYLHYGYFMNSVESVIDRIKSKQQKTIKQ